MEPRLFFVRTSSTPRGGELKNEIIQWDNQSSGFTLSNQNTTYPYNITLMATDAIPPGNITVIVGTVATKMLNITSYAPDNLTLSVTHSSLTSSGIVQAVATLSNTTSDTKFTGEAVEI